MTRVALAAALLLAGALPAGAHEVKAGALTLGDLSVRASLGAVPTSAAYLSIRNSGAQPDRLLSVDCACAQSASVHLSQTKGGVTSMAPTGPITIPAHGAVTFQPNALHIMLMGLKAPLKAGEVQRMTLHFEHAGAVGAGFQVRAVISATDSMAAMPGMSH
jgi:copper(I)-binding protein